MSWTNQADSSQEWTDADETSANYTQKMDGLRGGYWNDDGEWVDAATWDDIEDWIDG